MRDFFDPTPDEQNVVLIDGGTLRKAEKLIESCEHCNAEGAEIPFDNILDRVTGSDPSVTDYVLGQPAQLYVGSVDGARVFALDVLECPRCRSRMRILAAIEDPVVVRKILDSLGLPSRPHPLAPARRNRQHTLAKF